MTDKERTRSSIFDLKGVPDIKQALPLALQHVVAMIVGCVTPAIIVAGVAGLSEKDSVILIQAALIVSGISTLIQLFPFIHTRWFTIGSGLPIIMGISFAYLPSMQTIAAEFDIPTILGAQIVGGCVAVFVGLNIKRIRRFFPPLIAGTVVFTIGLSLYPTAINYMAGGVGSPDYGSYRNWIIAVITLVIVTLLNHYGRGIFKLASILIGIIGGYAAALCMGMVDFSPIAQASAFQLPMPLHFGVKFEISSCVAIGLLFAINSIQAIGDFSATTSGGLDRMPTDGELQGGIVGYGITNILCSLAGGTADSHLQPERGYRGHHKSCKPLCPRPCSRASARGGIYTEVFIPPDDDPVRSARRRDRIRVCFDRHDRDETYNIRKHVLPEHLHRRTGRRTRHGYITGNRGAPEFPGLVCDDIREITGSDRNIDRRTAEHHTAERSGGRFLKLRRGRYRTTFYTPDALRTMSLNVVPAKKDDGVFFTGL